MRTPHSCERIDIEQTQTRRGRRPRESPFGHRRRDASDTGRVTSDEDVPGGGLQPLVHDRYQTAKLGRECQRHPNHRRQRWIWLATYGNRNHIDREIFVPDA